MNDDKRRQRQLKRAIKKAGNRTRRQQLKRTLTENPAEAHFEEESVGRHSTEPLNGQDHDSTRKREDDEKE
jgi:hypothetical protein